MNVPLLTHYPSQSSGRMGGRSWKCVLVFARQSSIFRPSRVASWSHSTSQLGVARMGPMHPSQRPLCWKPRLRGCSAALGTPNVHCVLVSGQSFLCEGNCSVAFLVFPGPLPPSGDALCHPGRRGNNCGTQIGTDRVILFPDL